MQRTRMVFSLFSSTERQNHIMVKMSLLLTYLPPLLFVPVSFHGTEPIPLLSPSWGCGLGVVRLNPEGIVVSSSVGSRFCHT